MVAFLPLMVALKKPFEIVALSASDENEASRKGS
jgi:hypothetical protein